MGELAGRPVSGVVAAGVVLLGLAVPVVVSQPTPALGWSVPVEALLSAVVLVILPARLRRVLAAVLGGLLGLSTVLRLVDLGFFAALGRPFDLLFDWSLFGNGFEFLQGSFGPAGAFAALAVAVVLAVGVLVIMTWSVIRLARMAEDLSLTRRRVIMAGGAAGLAYLFLAAQILPGLPGVPPSGVSVALDRANTVGRGWQDQAAFASELPVDAFADTPGSELLTGLRGKDVVLVFVESYGRDALDDPRLAGPLTELLTAGSRLQATGYGSRSGFLTSSTFGGGSWLAHGTLLSGLWVDNEQRYRTLVGSDRMTLNSAFRRAGWRTIGVSPGTTGDWPEGGFFGFDRLYDSRTLGYRGANFSWATMPDQYTLAAFERLEHGRSRRPPIMAEVQLVSSHAPWAPIPEVLAWDAVGDGSVFTQMAEKGTPPSAILTRDPARVRADYQRAVSYSLRSLLSWVETYGDDDLVMIFLGDHQPNAIVTGEAAVRDVPISIVARDRAVLDRISGWRWSPGLIPSASAPVWRMDAFRDRFLTAFGPTASAGGGPR